MGIIESLKKIFSSSSQNITRDFPQSYGWCYTDHKDGKNIQLRYRSNDYLFGEEFARPVTKALQTFGLPIPSEDDVFRGTHHELLFLDTHGVVVRIGPRQDMTDLLHPGIIQPLAWITDPDTDMTVALYPGIDLHHFFTSEQYIQTYDISCLKQFLSQTQQTSNDTFLHNIGSISIPGKNYALHVPLYIDPDIYFLYTQNKYQMTLKTQALSTYEDVGLNKARAMRKTIRDLYSDHEDSQQWLQAFDVHHPLRCMLWEALSCEDPEQRADKLEKFWKRCARITQKPERVIAHEWTQYVNENGVLVWVKEETPIYYMSLYTHWQDKTLDPH